MLTELGKDIFEAARFLKEPERTRFLTAACGNAADLRGEIEALLAAITEADKHEFLKEEAISLRTPTVFQQGQLVAERFRVLRLIGAGGMGEVYEVYDEKLGRRRALKTLRLDSARDNDAIERFRREIRIACDFSNDHICRIFDLVEHRQADVPPGAPGAVVTCFTMQLVEGETLQHYLARKRPLAARDALPLIRQIASAIDTLHESGIVHRDLKPSNVMLTGESKGEPRLVVMDFGLAKPADAEREIFQSRIDLQAGAPYFVAPEILRSESACAASDIYALGLIVDEMVTSARAYTSESLTSLIYEKLNGAPVDPESRSSGLPREWSHAILRCLSARPQDRYVRAGDFVRDLEAGLSDEGAAATARAVVPGRKPKRRFLARMRWSKILTLALLSPILAVACLSLFALRPLNTSILVYPIENGTGEQIYDYICKGTSIEVRRRLNDIKGVQIVPYYEPLSKSKKLNPNTRFSLDGLLQRSGDRVRLTVELIDNNSGAMAWSGNFEDEVRDPLVLQTAIASKAVEKLQETVLFGPAEKRNGSGGFALFAPLRVLAAFQAPNPAPPPTVDPKAMDAYMRALSLWEQRTLPSTLAADDQLRDAISQDAKFALAYAVRSEIQLSLLDHNFASRSQLLDQARAYAEQAISSGPDLAEAHTALAAVRQHIWDWSGSEKSYRTAIHLNPKYSLAHRWYAGLLIQFGRFDEAMAEAETAVKLDPYDYSGQSFLGWALLYSGRYREAAAQLEGLLNKKDLLYGHELLGYVYAKLGTKTSENESLDYFNRAFRQAAIVEQREQAAGLASPDRPGLSGPLLAMIYAARGDQGETRHRVQTLAAALARGATPRLAVAGVYATLGDREAALKVLEQGVAGRDSGILYVKVSPWLESLHGDPRFESLVSRMGL